MPVLLATSKCTALLKRLPKKDSCCMRTRPHDACVCCHQPVGHTSRPASLATTSTHHRAHPEHDLCI
jgi:hypothetical protein